MRPTFWHWLPVLIVGFFVTGCTSTSSFFMRRFDNDRLAGNSNGELGIHDNAKPFKGIPITLKVPTHVDIVIRETIFLDANSLERVNTSQRNLQAVATTVYSDKLFSVDPKRAAGGNSDYFMDMNDSNTDNRERQYFKTLNQKVTDETIKDITAAINTLFPQVPKKPGTGGQSMAFAPEVSNGLLSMDRDVAWKRFDISTPDFEQQIRAFVDEQLNLCPTCGPTCSHAVHESAMSVVEQPSHTTY